MVREKRDIEHLVVWALRDQGLGWAGKERAREDWTDLGTAVDDDHVGSHPSISLWSDDDAMVIKLWVDRLVPEARALVVQYGRAGLRPDWCPEGYGKYQQLRDGRGRRLWVWSDPINRTGTKEPRMGFVGEQRETVDYHRAQWGVWWQGLADIVPWVNGAMEGHEATGPDVLREPWKADSVVPVVFGPDGEPLSTGVTSRPKVAEMALETRRYEANLPIKARANDWGVPASPLKRAGER